MKKITVVALFLLGTSSLSAQKTDEQVLKQIYKQALTNSKSYAWLDHLSNDIGARLSGSANAEKAVQYTKAEMEKLGFDKVYL
ncbi:MAG: peptidase M28 family protein, partial [Bacteroidetes bacterium]|nr:peptidase M28 family protein [Bacteroidota bacterium]